MEVLEEEAFTEGLPPPAADLECVVVVEDEGAAESSRSASKSNAVMLLLFELFALAVPAAAPPFLGGVCTE